MSTENRDSEAKCFIKAMLADSNMEIELQDQDYETIERQTMDVIAPYYEGTKYIYGQGEVIDLSNYPEVVSVHKIYDTEKTSDEFIQALYFGQPGVYIWDSNTMNNYLQYVSLQMLFNNFVTTKSYTWKYIRPKVYIHGYSSKGVILECFVRPTKFSDISYTSDKYALAKQYALALAKEIVGRTRSRFTIAGAPYQLDGAALIAEAQQEKADVIARIIPPIRVY